VSALRSLVRITLFALLSVMPAFLVAGPRDRIQGAIDSNRITRLRNNRNPLAQPVHDRGALAPSTMIHGIRLVLSPSEAQAADLEQLLEQQRDPSSPEYQRWLTPEQYGERFGASENDLARMASWLESQGLTVDETARARNWIACSGTAEQIRFAFRTELHRYEVDGETHFANATDPAVPAAVADLIGAIRGLDDFRPHAPGVHRVAPDYTASSTTHYLAPDDMATIYDVSPLYQAGFTGAGQKLVIVGQTDINLSDIRAFRSRFGLPALDPQVILTGPDPGVSAGDQVEAALDLEWSGAIARNASIIYVNSQNVFTSVQYAIDQNLAPVISMSYGACEFAGAASYRAMAQQANAQGITWLNSSGDSGAAGCDWNTNIARNGPVVVFPADIPEVTAVGGTEFAESGTSGWSSTNSATLGSATGYIPEKAWNDTPAGYGLAASGGGVSTVFAKPWWQSGPGVPNDGARDLPDISLTASGAHDGYLIYSSGSLMAVGGTSCSSPAFAGIVTLLNQYLVSKGAQAKPGLANINPKLYGLAQQGVSGVIHDITSGNNIVPCASGTKGCSTGSFGYSAGAGYDLVTGLGSVDAYNLVTKWTNLPAAVGTTMTLAASPASMASTGSTQLTATVTPVTGTNPPTGSITFVLGSTTLGSAAVVASGAKGTAGLSVKGTSLAAGNNTLTANYVASGNFANSTATALVAVTVPAVATTTTATANPASIATTGSTQLTATVKPASGSVAPSGTVTFTKGTTTLGSATISASGANGIAVVTVKGSSLAVGSNAIIATYAATSAFSGSSGTVTVTVTAPVNTTTTLAANPASIAASGTTVLTATVKPASGTVAPGGSITFTLGGTTLGTATLAASGSSATASLSVAGSKLTTGSNSLVATYGGAAGFNSSVSSPAIVTITAPVATSTAAAASPATIAATATTTLTVTVKPATGSAAPTGTVIFSLGGATLGTATLAASGSSGIASMVVKGSSLLPGSNTITVSYQPTGNFSASSANAVVSVSGTSVSTTTSVTASPASIAATGSSTLAVTVKAASGTTAPTGAVTFAVAGKTLGTATLSGTSGSATASFTVAGSNLVAGSNTITIGYSGGAPFASSSATIVLTITTSGAGTASVIATATRTTSIQQGWPVLLQLKEQAGIAATVTQFTINGTDFSSWVSVAFGSSQLAAGGSLSANLIIQWSPLPATLVFSFGGKDVNGHVWTQTVTMATK
jgi:subtilase family serine protease